MKPARIRAFFMPPIGRGGASARGLWPLHRLELMATLPGEPLYRAFGFAVMEHVEAVLPDGVRLVRPHGAR